MSSILHPSFAVPLVLAFVGFCLAGYLHHVLSAPPPTAAQAAPAAPPGAISDEPKLLSPPRSLPALQSFAEITTRPLFSQSRRPPEEKKVEQAKPVATKLPPKKQILTGQFSLVGVVYEGDESVAILKRNKASKVVQVMKNEQIDGWHVVSIKRDAVVLQQAGIVDTIVLGGRVRMEERGRR